MIDAFGRKTLGTLRPTWGTFFAPMLWGFPIGLVFGMLFLGTFIAGPVVVGGVGALYLFVFGHYKRSMVFFMGGLTGTVVSFVIYAATHAAGG